MVAKHKTSLKDRILAAIVAGDEQGMTVKDIAAKIKSGKSDVYKALAGMEEVQVLPKAKHLDAARYVMKPTMLAPHAHALLDKIAQADAPKGTVRQRILQLMPKDGSELHVDKIAELLEGSGTAGKFSPVISAMVIQYKELERLRRGYYKITPRGIAALSPEPQPVEEEESNQTRWTAALKARYNGFFEAIVKAAISRFYLDNIGFQDDFMDCYRWAEQKILGDAVTNKSMTKADAASLMRQPKNMQALIGLAHNVENELIRIQSDELERLTAEKVSVTKVGDASLCTTEDLIAVLLQRGRTVMQAISGLPANVTQMVTAMLSGLTLTPALANPVEPTPEPAKRQSFKIGIVGIFEHDMRYLRENTDIKKLEIDGDLELVWHPDVRGKVNYRPDFGGVVICNSLATAPMVMSARGVFKRSLVAPTKQMIPEKVLELLRSLQEQATA